MIKVPNPQVTRAGYQVRVPMSSKVVKVITHDSGGITAKEAAIELAVNIFIFGATVVIGGNVDPLFGIAWAVLVLLALIFAGESLRFKIFTRRPARDMVTFEGANVPVEPLERYERLQSELIAAIEEIDALTLEK